MASNHLDQLRSKERRCGIPCQDGDDGKDEDAIQDAMCTGLPDAHLLVLTEKMRQKNHQIPQ